MYGFRVLRRFWGSRVWGLGCCSLGFNECFAALAFVRV